MINAPQFESFEQAQAWRAELQEEFADDATFSHFCRAVGEWQEGAHAEISLAMDGVLAGTDWDSRTHLLLKVLALANHEAPELFRGVILPTTADVKAEFRLGESFDPPLSSFTTSLDEARYRATCRWGEQGIQLLFRVVPGARAVPIENLATREELWMEREWYSAGRFTVIGTATSPEGYIWVTLQHEVVYDVG